MFHPQCQLILNTNQLTEVPERFYTKVLPGKNLGKREQIITSNGIHSWRCELHKEKGLYFIAIGICLYKAGWVPKTVCLSDAPIHSPINEVSY